MHSRCPHCRSEYELDDTLRGQTLNCVQCQKTFTAEEFTPDAAPKAAVVPQPKPPAAPKVVPTVKPPAGPPADFYEQPLSEPAPRQSLFHSSGDSPNPGLFWKSAVLLLLVVIALLLSLPYLPAFYRYEVHAAREGEILDMPAYFGCRWELISVSAPNRAGERNCVFRQRIPFFLKKLAAEDDVAGAAGENTEPEETAGK